MKWSIERKIMTGAGVALAVLLINGLISYRATRSLVDHERLVSQTHQVLTELQATISTVTDAETGERGYIITGEESYLEPYRAAVEEINGHVETLTRLTADNPNQQARIPVLERKIADRLEKLKTGIDLRRSGGVEGAKQLILSGSGKRLMDDLRSYIDGMESDENDLLKRRSDEAKASGRNANLTFFVGNLIACMLLLSIAYLIVRDIGVRRKAQEALHQQREWLRVTLSSIGDAVIATDTDSTVTFMNQVAQSLTGWTQEEAEGKPLVEVFNIINAETGEPSENPVAHVLREGKVVGLANHTRLIARDGAEIPIDDSAAPIKNEDSIVGVVLVFRDVTERNRHEEALRESQAELAGMIASAMDAIVTIDAEQRIVIFNAAAEQMFGWSRDQVIGKPIDMLIPGRFRDIHATHIRAFGEAGVTRRSMGALGSIFGVRADGEEFPIEASIAQIKTKEHKLYSVILRDDTERRRAEEERGQLLLSERAARERAEAASRAKDEFVAMVSHEIRSPLGAILGWAQLLRTGKFDQEETARALETIERNAKLQTQLIEDLLDISRVITGKLTLDVRPVEPSQIIEAALESIRPAADAKSIQLHVYLDSQSGQVSGDPNRIQQIVWNLLSNAVKFTPGNGRIEVRLERINSHVQLTVSDSGVGINPEFLPYVFDRFSQANTTSERRHGGLGLGLAIVRHLVELHGGTVQAGSLGEGKGAKFTVTLPVRVVREEIGELKHIKPALRSVVPHADTIMLDGLRVMIVDDEAETCDLLKMILTQRGAEVKACASAAEALEAIEQWRPFLLVSDIGMPDEDGYSLISRLRELPPERGGNTPAVALTAYARTDDRMRTLAAGFQMHVAKPVEAIELIMVIASFAGRTGKGTLAPRG